MLNLKRDTEAKMALSRDGLALPLYHQERELTYRKCLRVVIQKYTGLRKGTSLSLHDHKPSLVAFGSGLQRTRARIAWDRAAQQKVFMGRVTKQA